MTEFHLVVFYQHEENYGAHTWDGKGKCPQGWKMKGGSDEIVTTLSTAEVTLAGSKGLKALADNHCTVEDNESFRQYPIGFELATVDTDLLVRVRDALTEERKQWGDDPYIHMVVAINLRVSESIVKLAMEQLETAVLPSSDEGDYPYAEYDEVA